MNNKFLIAGFFVLIALAPMFTFAQKADKFRPLADEVLQLINKHRAQIRLKPLQMNENIIPVARQHSINMANETVEFGHDGFEDRVNVLKKKIKPCNAWAENVAMGTQLTAPQVVKMWLNSPEHKENIEGNYNQTGIGIARNANGDLYFTQLFMRVGK